MLRDKKTYELTRKVSSRLRQRAIPAGYFIVVLMLVSGCGTLRSLGFPVGDEQQAPPPEEQSEASSSSSGEQKTIGKVGQNKPKRSSGGYRTLGKTESVKQGEFCGKLSVKVSLSDPQSVLIAQRTYKALGCPIPDTAQPDRPVKGSLRYWLVSEKGEVPSELLRAVYVHECFDKPYSPRKYNAAKIGDMVLCGPDARRLNAEKMTKELKSLGVSERGISNAQKYLSNARSKYEAIKAELTKITDADADAKRAIFDAPEKAFKLWLKLFEKNKSIYLAARDLEKRVYRGKKSAIVGCSKKARKDFAAYVKSRHAKNLQEAQSIAADAVGNLLLSQLIVCDAYDEHYLEAAELYKVLATMPSIRGPREAAAQAASAVFQLIGEDNEKSPLAGFHVGGSGGPQPWVNEAKQRTVGNKYMYAEMSGTVERQVKAKGGKIKFVFKKESWKKDIYACKETNKVERINPDGTIIYRRDCKYKGKKTIVQRPPDLIVRKETAQGIKKGRFVVAVYDRPSGEGIALEVHKNRKKKDIIAFMGISL